MVRQDCRDYDTGLLVLERQGGLTVGGDRLMVEPRRSWGPMLECLRMGRPPPGVPPGLDAQLGAIRILGVIRVLSESRRLGKAFWTRRKLLSGEEGEAPNHQPPSTPESVKQAVKHRDATPGTSHAISRDISTSISHSISIDVISTDSRNTEIHSHAEH